MLLHPGIPSGPIKMMDLVDHKFDFRMAKQKETFLVHDQHDTAKYHRRMRTKFDRLVLAIHYVGYFGLDP